jgi:hypothetical protein
MEIKVGYSRKGLAVGFLIVAIGLILLLDQQGVVSASYVFRFFWPAIFIFFGIETALCPNASSSRRLVGLLMIAFGGLLLLGALGILHVGLYSLWPLLLIIWGVWVIGRAFGGDGALSFKIKAAIRDKFENATGTQSGGEWADKIKDSIHESFHNFKTGDSTESEFDYMAIFGGIKQRVAVKNFRGGRLMAIFGGFELDLTRADIEGPSAVIDASALMGGGEIRVPDTWIVELRGTALLGGYTDETHQHISDSATAKHLIVKGIAALGGVVIKN